MTDFEERPNRGVDDQSHGTADAELSFDPDNRDLGGMMGEAAEHDTVGTGGGVAGITPDGGVAGDPTAEDQGEGIAGSPTGYSVGGSATGAATDTDLSGRSTDATTGDALSGGTTGGASS